MNLSPPSSLFSPISDIANASLYFQVSAGGGSVDAATGNYIPNTNTVQVTAKMAMSNDKTEVQPGVNENLITVSGWFVNPTNPPVTIKHGMQVDCLFAGVRGTLEFLAPIPNPYVTEAITAGGWGFRFNGIFRREE